MSFVDWTVGRVMDVGKLGLAFVALAVLGGVLSAVADMTVPNLIAGTPLGPSSELAPMAWTSVALGGLALVWGWKQ